MQLCEGALTVCKAHCIRMGNHESIGKTGIPVGYMVPQSISNYFKTAQVFYVPVLIVRKGQNAQNGGNGNGSSYCRY